MSNTDKKLNPQDKDPDIFHAAETNDVAEMLAALAAVSPFQPRTASS